MEDEFELFWSIYPRHIAKAYARQCFIRARTKVSLSVILDGLARYIEQCGIRGDHRFIAHASTWLNQERWADEFEVAPIAPAASESPELSQWRLRIKFYKKDAFWLPFWGEKPDDPRCIAPVEVLSEFGYRAMH